MKRRDPRKVGGPILHLPHPEFNDVTACGVPWFSADVADKGDESLADCKRCLKAVAKKAKETK